MSSPAATHWCIYATNVSNKQYLNMSVTMTATFPGSVCSLCCIDFASLSENASLSLKAWEMLLYIDTE